MTPKIEELLADLRTIESDQKSAVQELHHIIQEEVSALQTELSLATQYLPNNYGNLSALLERSKRCIEIQHAILYELPIPMAR